MPKIRTFSDEFLPVLLAQAASSYSQSFSQVFSDCERVLYLAVGHASANIAFNVTIAEDSSGTNPTDIFTTPTTIAAGKIYTLEIGPGILTAAKQFVSPKITVTAGTFSLLRLKYDLRYAGDLTHDSTYGAFQQAYFQS